MEISAEEKVLEDKDPVRSLDEIIEELQEEQISLYYLKDWDDSFYDSAYYDLLNDISIDKKEYNKILLTCHETGLSAVKVIKNFYPEYFTGGLSRNEVIAIDYLFMLIGDSKDKHWSLPLTQNMEYFGMEAGYCSVHIYCDNPNKTFEKHFGDLKENGIDLEKFLKNAGRSAHFKAYLLERIISQFEVECNEIYDNLVSEKSEMLTSSIEFPNELITTKLEDYFTPDYIDYNDHDFFDLYPDLWGTFRNADCYSLCINLLNNNQNELHKLKFANDVLGIPPVLTLASMYIDSINVQWSQEELGWLDTFFEYYFCNLCTNYKAEIVELNDKRTGILKASVFIKQDPTQARYHFLTEKVIKRYDREK